MKVIHRLTGGLPEYLTMNSEYATTQPIAFTSDKSLAMQFGRQQDAEHFQKKMRAWLPAGTSIGDA